MILFRPVGRPPEVFDFSGALIAEPLTSNPYALDSPKVYCIFVGPNWEQNGSPTAAVKSMIAAAKAILSSSYLSGLTQYGSDGNATFQDFTIDTSLDPVTWTKSYPNGTTNNPVWFETNQILSNPNFSSWNPPPGDARNSPIYVVVRYLYNGTGVGGSSAGSNSFGPQAPYTTLPVNVIDVQLTSADQVDQFSWVFSHEIAERISTGIGGLAEVSPDSGGQIADGEPEGSDYYAWRLNGSSGPVVTSYWSFLDQAFIVPDGNLQRVLLVPIWNGASWTGKCASLQQGSLYEMSPPSTTTLIDTQVQSYAVTSAGRIFDLTVEGQVKEYSGSGTNWTAVTGANTVASSLVSTSDGGLYMIASNDGGRAQVWQFGSGTSWTALTGTNTSVSSIAAAGRGLYMMAANDPGGTNNQVWQYSGSGTSWTAVTGTNTYVYAIAAASGSLYMMASNDGGPTQVWQYGGSGTNWTAVTGSNTSVYSIAVTGDVLCIVAANTGDVTRVWQYGLAPSAWIPLTGTNTSPSQIAVQDGIGLYMVASNDSGPRQVWQYSGTPNNWTALTGMNTNVDSISIGADNHLYMLAANDGGAVQKWRYDGSPNQWTVV